VLADDSVLFREGLARVLTENGFLVTGRSGDADALRLLVGRDEPDVVVTDIRMPPTTKIAGGMPASSISARCAEPTVTSTWATSCCTTVRPGRIRPFPPVSVDMLADRRLRVRSGLNGEDGDDAVNTRVHRVGRDSAGRGPFS
jgi:CheY-like chemotaxis protein